MKTQNKFILVTTLVVFVLAFYFWPSQQLKSLAPVIPPSNTRTSNQSPVVAPSMSQQMPPLTQTKTVLFTSNAEQRPFSKMGVLERDAIVDEIAKQDLPSIFQTMLDAERVEHDSMKQLDLSSIFSGALQVRTASPEFLKLLYDFVEDKANTTFEREQVLGALGTAATKQTLDLLIQIATTSPDQEMSQVAAANIGPVGTGRGGSNQEELAPALDQVWRESRDKDLLGSVAEAMAQVGAASSMELLVTAALARAGTDDIRKQAALEALETADILNDNAVPPLAMRLSNQSPTSVASELAGNTLARIPIPVAAHALVAWLQNATANAAPLIPVIVSHTQYAEIWHAALDPKVPFSSETNREAIRSALAKLKASSTFGSP